MKCPNCGEEIEKGYLYCEKCGEEIRIVPDFEPEIENSIIETLSAVAIDVEPPQKDVAETEEDVFVVESTKKVRKRIIYALLIFVVFVFGVYRFALSRTVEGQENYLEEQIENARKEYDQKHYKEAAGFYEKALKREQSAELLISYADCLFEMGEIDQALSNYYAAIDLEADNEMAYARIIAMYEADQAYEEINQLLIASGNEKIQAAFQNYMAIEPVFSYEGGTYNKVIPLKITAAASGDLYYTLNGTDPMRNGNLYTSPIFLRSGEYYIKAVYINDYGICSDIVETKFEIENTQPDPPEVVLQSGQYTTPQMISVIVPEKCIVYYTTDGSVPDENSFIYGEPIPMREGVTNYRFVSLSEEGVYSEVVARSYQLMVETTLTAEESINRLKFRLVEKQIILDSEGSIPNMPGKNIYVYNSLQIVEDKIMHVIYEYYQEGNQSRNMTGRIFCIDVSNGYVYRIAKDENGNQILEPI